MIETTLKELFGPAGLPQSTSDGGGVGTALAPMIMIVEDDADIACSLTIRLRSKGLRTCVAGDAVTAIRVGRENDPDAAILDISMPGGDGFEVAEALRTRAETSTIPVMFLTASMRGDLRERAESFPGARFMTKPYDANALLESVADMLEGRPEH